MKCPTCEVNLLRSERLGTAVLICPECCGEWVSSGLMARLTRLRPAADSGHGADRPSGMREASAAPASASTGPARRSPDAAAPRHEPPCGWGPKRPLAAAESGLACREDLFDWF